MKVLGRGSRRRVLPFVVMAAVLAGTLAAPAPASAQPLRPDSVPRKWVAQHAGNYVVAVLTDTVTHRVFVVGAGRVLTGQYLVVAYSATGRELWSKLYVDRHGSDGPRAAVLDPVTHRIYVTGDSSGPWGERDLTVAYDADGNRLWVATSTDPPDGSGRNALQEAYSIAVDPGNHQVYVTGGGRGPHGRMVTVAYDADGHQLWFALIGGNPKSGGAGQSVAVDPVSHDVVVVGSSSSATSVLYSSVTVAYDAAGHQLWMDRGALNVTSGSRSVAIDPGTRTTFATGGSTSGCAVVAYDDVGHRLWTRRSPERNNPCEIALVDPGTHRLFVVGQQDRPNGWRAFKTIAYDADGTVLWSRFFSGGIGLDTNDSYPMAAALDTVNHAIYVTGASTAAPGYDNYDMATVGYDQSGTRLWTTRYGGADYEIGLGIAVDPGRGVFVAGYTMVPPDQYSLRVFGY